MSLNKLFLIRFFLCVFITGTSEVLCAQFSLGVHGSYMQTFANDNVSHFGIGTRGEVALSEKFAVRGGFHYFFSSDHITSIQAKAIQVNVVPQTVSFNATSNLALMSFHAGVKYYLVGAIYSLKKKSSFGVYAGGELSILSANYASVMDNEGNSLNRGVYEVPITDSQLGGFTNFNLIPYAGIEKGLGPLFAYLEAKAAIKIFDTSISGLEINMPFLTVLNAGVRIPIGSDY